MGTGREKRDKTEMREMKKEKSKIEKKISKRDVRER